MTIEEWLREAEERLRAGPHPDRARRDAERLLMHALRLDRAALLARSKDQVAGTGVRDYTHLLERRFAGEPIQYITGETEFYGLPFRVTPDVLIPRPETEHLVEKAIELAGRFKKPRIVDVGTGSGAIAVALARALPGAQLTATDLSVSALETARSNAQRNGGADRIRFLHGDLLAPVAGERFELIVSNPPYVAAVDKPSLAIEVRDHEPAIALFAGEDGMEAIRRLIPAAFDLLVPGGWLAMEFGYGQWPQIRPLLAYAGFTGIDALPDLQGIPRVAAAMRPGSASRG